MKNYKNVDLAGWKLRTIRGDTFYSDGSTIEFRAMNNHDAYVFKPISLPLCKSVKIEADVEKFHASESDVCVGLIANNEHYWGAWTGRDSRNAVATHIVTDKQISHLLIRFAGEWGNHDCVVYAVRVYYETVDAPTEPGPDQGVGGEILKTLQRLNAEIIRLSEQLDDLESAQEWIKTYNRNKVGDP